ncbi:MAG: long-chain fatty acid--CoA ligase [Acidobacteriota bacterium]
MSEQTLFDLYRRDVEAPRKDHYRHYYPGGVRSFDTEEFFQSTAFLAEGLASLGVGRGDRVMLLADNRPEWHMADLAVINLGAADVPIYGTLTPQQIAYQANDSGAVAAIVENSSQMAKFQQIRDACPSVKHLIQIEGGREPGCVPLADLLSAGKTTGAGGKFWQRAAQAKDTDLVTIVYTSGTTGEPKGVMLTHRNFVANVLASAPRVPVDRSDLALEFLPLCHVLERMLGYVYMWRATSKAYCSVYDVGELLASIKPTLFAGVPRFFEKLRGKIMEAIGASGVKAAMFNWAVATGKEASNRRIAGKPVEGALAWQHRLADRLVFTKIRAGLGGRVRYAISGGAALPLHVAQFFHALGIQVLEGYGLTETSPVIAVNGAERGWLRLGTVGKPLENVTIKLAGDGELLVKGPSITSGYWNKPDQTAEVFDGEGFFHTGDIADLDDDGFLLITDRKKDLIVTAGGKNVAPQPIENELKRSPLVDNAVLIGDGRPAIVALISPNGDELQKWATQQGISFATLAELTRHERVRVAYAQVIDSVNAGLSRYEQIKSFRVLPQPLSLEAGQLTPTLKVKRRVTEKEYAALVEEMY